MPGPDHHIRISAAFATELHARRATRTIAEWLETAGHLALVQPEQPDGLAIVQVDICPSRMEALLTLLRGLHGVPTIAGPVDAAERPALPDRLT